MYFLKRIAIWGSLAGILYILLSYHFVVINSSVKMLKKSKLTLNYTFYNTKGRSNEAILAVGELRKDGVADLLIDAGKMSEKDEERIMKMYEK